MEDGKHLIVSLPNQKCTLSTGCLNWYRRKRGWTNEIPPFFASGREWSQDAEGAKAYEEFLKNCPHNVTGTETGCDGVTTFKIVRCAKCGLVLQQSGQQVWGDACV